MSDFLLQYLGLISILLFLNFFYWGVKLTAEKIIRNFIPKIFFTLTYILFGTTVLNILYNDSFWLIDNGNGGFVGNAIKENIYYFSPLIQNEYVIYVLILLTTIFFILSLGIKASEIKKILLFPFLITKKITTLFSRDIKKNNNSTDISNIHSNTENYEENTKKEKQPILPFAKQKEIKSTNSNFKLPSINFLEKNTDLKNKKNIDNSELAKNS